MFDRELRELLFSAITRAEATLKAVCAHEFTRLHPTWSTRISIPTIMIPGAVRAPWR
ncbi:MAG: hypothetical protein ACLSUZ_00990 [Bifidobacterium pseudocatenulatum]